MTESSLVKIWQDSLGTGRLATAWAVVAPKDRFASIVDQFAQVLGLTAADCLTIEPEEGKRSLSIKLVRPWLVKTHLSARGLSQLAVVLHADMLERAAISPFLKALEEPSSDTYYLLMLERDNLMATIRSRVQIAVIDTPDEEQANLSGMTFSDMLNWATGAANNEDYSAAMRQILRRVQSELSAGRLDPEIARRAVKVASSTSSGINRKMQLLSLLSQLNK